MEDSLVKKSLICKYCNKTFEEAVSLPCSGTICKAHLNNKNDGHDDHEFKCPICLNLHRTDQVVPNSFINSTVSNYSASSNVCEVICNGNGDSKHLRIDLGPKFESTRTKFNTFEKHLEHFNDLLTNPNEKFLDGEFGRIKSDLRTRANDLKELIDLLVDDLNESLDDFKSNCSRSALKVSTSYLNDLDYFKRENDAFKSDLVDDIKIDEHRWTAINKRIDLLEKLIREKTKSVESSLLLDKRFKLSLLNTDNRNSKFIQKLNQMNQREYDTCRYLEKKFFYSTCGHSFCNSCSNDDKPTATSCCKSRSTNQIFVNYCISDLISELNHYFQDVYHQQPSFSFDFNNRTALIDHFLAEGSKEDQIKLLRCVSKQISSNLKELSEDKVYINQHILNSLSKKLFDTFAEATADNNKDTEDEDHRNLLRLEIVNLIANVSSDNLGKQRELIVNSNIPCRLADIIIKEATTSISDQFKELTLYLIYQLIGAKDSKSELKRKLIDINFLGLINRILADPIDKSGRVSNLSLAALICLVRLSEFFGLKEHDSLNYLNKLNVSIPILNILINKQYPTYAPLILNSCRVLVNLMIDKKDETVVSEDQIRLMLDNLNLDHLINLLNANTDANFDLIHQVLRLIGCMAVGADHQISQIIANSNLLPNLAGLLDDEKQPILIVKETCWIIRNLVLSSTHHFQEILNSQVMIKLIEILHFNDYGDEDGGNQDVQTRYFIVETIKRIIDQGTPAQVNYLVTLNVIKALVASLDDCRSLKLIELELECVYNLLKAGILYFELLQTPSLTCVAESMNKNVYADAFKLLGGMRKIRQFNAKTYRGIFERANKIIDNFC